VARRAPDLAEHRVVADDHPVAEHHTRPDDDVRAEDDVAPNRRGRAEDEAGGGRVGHGGYPRRVLAPPEPTTPLRGAVLGLGMIGRHHARLLQSSPRVAFAGAVDPSGDRFGAVAAAGVHVLVEKPLAATADEARAIIDACAAAGVHGAVGHVERFNPALLEMRRRVQDGQVGQVFLIATERIGPFPDRIRDVGVVKDLATHDLDLVRWLGGAPVQRVAAETQHRMGRAHEDMVLATGRLTSGATFNCTVDWLSPAKVRRTKVLGERGMLVADTLTADLAFYANGQVTSEWSATQALRGVSEGDMTRYAFARREPLLAELDAFCDLLQGTPGDPVVTLEEGLATVVLAEAVLASAASGETITLGGPA
jgi:UDP-N-acetylglucosamine 3-dehydrogenase